MNGIHLQVFLLVAALLLIDLYVLSGLKGASKKWKFLQKKRFPLYYWLFSIFLIADLFFVVYVKMGVMGRVGLITFFFLVFLFKISFVPFIAIDDLRRLFIYIKNKISTRR